MIQAALQEEVAKLRAECKEVTIEKRHAVDVSEVRAAAVVRLHGPVPPPYVVAAFNGCAAPTLAFCRLSAVRGGGGSAFCRTRSAVLCTLLLRRAARCGLRAHCPRTTHCGMRHAPPPPPPRSPQALQQQKNSDKEMKMKLAQLLDHGLARVRQLEEALKAAKVPVPPAPAEEDDGPPPPPPPRGKTGKAAGRAGR